LTISDGEQFHQINMPNVIGRTSTEAKKALEENNLVVLIQTLQSGTSPADVVLSTIPNPGETIKQGSEVTMVVSLGPGPIAQANDQKVKKKIVVINSRMSEGNL